MARTQKRVSDSATEHAQLLMPENINGRNRLFGGRLMEWLDSLGAIVARRHANCDVITVCVDSLEFLAAAYVNSTIVLKGCVTYVGKSSMEIKIDTYCEAIDNSRYLINRAYIVYVAVDENDRPKEAPALILETEEQKAEYNMALKRQEMRKIKRTDS